MLMTPANHRVVDRVLTEHARGYSNDDMQMVGKLLFPVVTVPSRGTKRIEFGKEALMRYNTRRARGAEIQRIGLGYEGVPINLEQHALGPFVPREDVQDAEAGPGIDMQKEAVDAVSAIFNLSHERRAAAEARDPNKYATNNKLALTGTAKWSDDASDPGKAVEEWKEQVRSRCGFRPNTMVLTAPQASRCKFHPKIREHFKLTTAQTVTYQMLKDYFDVKHFGVAEAVETLDGDTLQDVWGNDLILAFVNHSERRTRRQPSYGYTFGLRGYPIVTPLRWDPDTQSWKGEQIDEWSPEVVGDDSGFLAQNVL